ncbi:MAG: hypothetical protein AB7U73_01960 [Pirellulales bacterium]
MSITPQLGDADLVAAYNDVTATQTTRLLLIGIAILRKQDRLLAGQARILKQLEADHLDGSFSDPEPKDPKP